MKRLARMWPLLVVAVAVVLIAVYTERTGSSVRADPSKAAEHLMDSAEMEEARADREAARVARQEVGVNASEFSLIKSGQTYEEVEEIVGSPGELLSSTDLGGYKGAVVSWEGEPGTELGANVVVQFQNGRVISKSQFGL